MASAFLFWRELQSRDLPRVCVTCGERDTDWAPRRLKVLRHRIFYRRREWIDVDLPFCPTHYSPPWAQLGATRAWDFTDDGVYMVNVSPDFIDALERYRDGRDRRTPQERGKLQDEGGVPADDDCPRIQRRRPTGAGVAPVLYAIVAGLLLVGGLTCAGGLFCVNLVLPKLGRPGVGAPVFKGPAGPGFRNPEPRFGPKLPR